MSTTNPTGPMHARYTYTAMLFHWLIAVLVVSASPHTDSAPE